MTGVSPVSYWLSYFLLDVLYVTFFFAGPALVLVYLFQERYLLTMNGGAG